MAERANVSTAVVSYVINNGPRQTSPAVRERVLAAELKPRGDYLLLYPLTIDEDPAALAALLCSGHLDGIVLRVVQDPPATDHLIELVQRTEIPCVWIERPAAPRFGLTSVTYDDLGGGYLATRRLIERGHRRIAHLQGDVRYATAWDRLAGYKRALSEAGRPIDERLIRAASWEMAEAATAIFAASDDMALGVVERLRALGRRMPDDVAVVGFDGIPLRRDIDPPLITIRVPFHELGRRAAELVLGPPKQADPAHQETLPVELMLGGSS